ncbi:mitochondrial import inner membrane translocase subunit Tim54, partial [Entophlyctis helioformis]
RRLLRLPPAAATSIPNPSADAHTPHSAAPLPRRPYRPSRNMLIFFTTAAAVAGLAAYDKWQVSRIRQSIADRAAVLANQPMDPNDLPRKVTVFIEPTYWARYWFKEYVKPVFDAAALDYDLVEPKHTAMVRSSVRTIMWNAREMFVEDALKEQEKIAREARRRTWAGWFAGFFYLPSRDPNDYLPPGLRLPKYDPEMGVVAVGPLVWRHAMLGMVEGASTVPTQVTLPAPDEAPAADAAKKDKDAAAKPAETADALAADEAKAVPKTITKIVPSEVSPEYFLPNSIAFPALGYITGKNQSGWRAFPSRIYGWFNQRYDIELIGEEALRVAFDNKRPFVAGTDEMTGAEDLSPLSIVTSDDEEKKQRVPGDEPSLDDYTREAAGMQALGAPEITKRMRVYA